MFKKIKKNKNKIDLNFSDDDDNNDPAENNNLSG